MNYQNKTKEVLIKELQKLQKKHDSLKSLYEKDITKLKLAEKVLPEPGIFYRDLIDLARDTIFSITPQGLFGSLNKAFEKITGWQTQEWVGKPFTDLLHPEDIPLAAKRFSNVLKGHRDNSIELRIRKKSGVYVYIEVLASPRMKKSLINGIMGIGRDITERKQTEMEINRQKEMLQSIFDHIPVMITYFDETGNIGMINRELVKKMGWSFEEWQTKNILSKCYPEPETLKKALDFMTSKQTGWKDFKVTTKYGTVIDTVWTNISLTNGVKMGIGQDITKRKQAEKVILKLSMRQEAILAAVPEIIIQVDENKIYTWANQSGLKFFGNDVLGKEASFYFEGEQKTYSLVQPLFDGSKDVFYLESWQRRCDGKKRLLGWWCKILKDEQDKVKGALSSARDITENKQAEEALRKSELKYRNLIEQAPDIIFVVDAEGNLLHVNQTGQKMLGYSEDELYKMKIVDTYPTDEMMISQRRLKQMRNIHAGETMHFERLMRRKDGTLFPVEISVGALKDGNTHAIIRDITERKQMEAALQQEKENFRHSLDDSPLGVRIATIEGNTIYANKTILDFYGYKSLGELQKTLLKDRYTPESYAQAQKRKYERICGDLSTTDYEISIVRKNGEIRHLQVYRNEVLWNGERQFQVLYKDITIRKQAEAALRKSEARFRSLFENSLMGISVTRPDGHLVHANLAYARMFGYKNPEEMLAEVSNVRQLYSNPEDRKEVLQILNRNGFMEARTFEVIRRDGSRFPVLSSAREIREIDGKLIHIQSTHIDISERRQTEEKLRNSKELLEKLNQHLHEVRENERAVISREIHDELGQSLTALKLDLNMMHTCLDNNPEAVAKLQSMIELVSNTIKDVQRISSDLRPGILDELGLISAIEWYCDEFEKRTGIKCKLKLDNSDYDDSQINLTFFRVLQETLTNVIRHAKASSVSIKLHKLIKGATMTIQDNGIGIHEEKIRSTKSFGLMSMRERVKQFNGTLDISSKKDNGTKLVIFIPS